VKIRSVDLRWHPRAFGALFIEIARDWTGELFFGLRIGSLRIVVSQRKWKT
jgi:hypothetical protein